MNYNYTERNDQELLIQMLTWDFDIISWKSYHVCTVRGRKLWAVWRAEHLKALFFNLFYPIVKGESGGKEVFHWTGVVTQNQLYQFLLRDYPKSPYTSQVSWFENNVFFLFATLRDYKERFNSQLIDLQSSHFGLSNLPCRAMHEATIGNAPVATTAWLWPSPGVASVLPL